MLYPKYINIHDPLSISFLSSLPIVYRIRMRIERWVSYEIVHCSTKIRVKLFFMLLMFFRCILIEFTNHLICTPGLGATTLLEWTQMNFMRSLTLISLFKKFLANNYSSLPSKYRTRSRFLICMYKNGYCSCIEQGFFGKQ